MRVREAGRVVLGDGQVGDAELHPGRSVVGAGGGDPQPRGLAAALPYGETPWLRITAAGTDNGSPGVQFGITDLTVTQYGTFRLRAAGPGRR
ncbi:hypothetical protein MAHJHV63_55240 [Mycobacterium avium subsp. hominissuis]